MPCEVQLIAHTNDPVRVVAAAAKLCYSASSASALFDGLDAQSVRYFLQKLQSAGHFSPFEHASFTFAIDGISRVATHQLVRHRVASYSQQSQRYVTMGRPRPVTPPSIADDESAAALFEEQVRASFATYERLAELGIPKEDARFILPHGWESSLVMTMNARELHHFFRLRLCRRAQWEIRGLASNMLALVREAAFELFEYAGPGCLTEGRCPELTSCDKPYTNVCEIVGDGKPQP